jgi:hypothetical protein
MNKIVFSLVLIVSVGSGIGNSANAGSASGNTLYETLHVKQMAKRDFTNNGRTKYVYVKSEQQIVYPITSSDKCLKKSLSGNTLYDAKQRKQYKGLPPCGTEEIGAVHLDKNSKVRELNVAVDLPKIGLRPLKSLSGAKPKVSLAPVYSENKLLKKINIVVDGKVKN